LDSDGDAGSLAVVVAKRKFELDGKLVPSTAGRADLMIGQAGLCCASVVIHPSVTFPVCSSKPPGPYRGFRIALMSASPPRH